jgi:hypothetical protein
MDRLRRAAESAELAYAVAGIEILRNRMLVSRSPASHQAMASPTATSVAEGKETFTD